MAEGGLPQGYAPATAKLNTVCRYFVHGVCSKGSSCRYIHDKSRSVPSDNICKYYQYSKCTYGEKCRYDHVKREDLRQSVQANHSTSVQSQPKAGSRANSDTRQPQMVTLSKKGLDHSIRQSQKKKVHDAKWAQAKAFVPGQKYYGGCPSSYAAATGGNDSDLMPTAASQQHTDSYAQQFENGSDFKSMESYASGVVCPGIGGLPRPFVTADTPLCPFYAAGECLKDDDCEYVHGDICDMCGLPQLHPANKKQRQQHCKECLADHEKEMEKAFALQASEDKECGICLESVRHKEATPDGYSDRRFGILENCNHCFCLTCIRQWRGNKEVSIETHRTCPTCRTHSDFITPSKFWVETSEEKTKLIEDYKKALKAKPCRYFKKGKGECPFDRKCFYRHALADGTVVEENQVRRRRCTNAEGEQAAVDEDFVLWNYINQRADNIEAGLSLMLLEIFRASDDEHDSSSIDSRDFYGWDSDSSEN